MSIALHSKLIAKLSAVLQSITGSSMRNGGANETVNDIGDFVADRLKGVDAISRFIGEPRRRTYYLLETRQIRAGKQGNNWIGSKELISEDYRKLMRGDAA